MIELLLFSLILGLFITEVVVLRMLTQRQTNKILKTLVTDWNPKRKSTDILPVQKPSPSFVLQHASKTMKN